MVLILTALYFHVLRPEDRVAVNPHAASVFHAMRHMMCNQTRETLETSAPMAAREFYRHFQIVADAMVYAASQLSPGKILRLNCRIEPPDRLHAHPPGWRIRQR
jgi:pyruvate dehydrogenase E1 component